MLSLLPSQPYPGHVEGYWSPVTSTINWCEEDYYATIYSAEIINSVTNLSFAYLAFIGIFNCLRHNHDRIFLVSFVFYLFIGLGSFCFHSTLTYSMQLVDELSMTYAACISFYASFSYGRSKMVSSVLLIFAVSLAVFITGYYHYLQDPTFHQQTFLWLTIVVVLRNIYVMETTLRPSRRLGDLAKMNTTSRMRVEQRDMEIISRMWSLIGVGLGTALFGYAFWLADIGFCEQFRSWRHQIGLPWGMLLEGHGWWHVFTSIGAYNNLVWAIWLRYCVRGEQDDVELYWPSVLRSIPTVRRKGKREVGVKKQE